MNRSEAKALLARLHFQHGLARPATDDTIDEWHRLLQSTPVDVGLAALDRLLGEGRPPSLARVIAEIGVGRGALANRASVGAPGCPMCEGVGFVRMMDDVDRHTPCPECRREPLHNRPQPPPKETLHVGAYDDAQARRDWWKAGGAGHYPGCKCDRCKASPRPVPASSALRARYTPRNSFRSDVGPPATVVTLGLALIKSGDPDGMDKAIDNWIDAGRPGAEPA